MQTRSSSSPASGSFASSSQRVLAEAIELGIPPTLGHNWSHAFPWNSTPYVLSSAQLVQLFGVSVARKALLDRLLEAVERTRGECSIHAMLVGGSFVDLCCDRPRDLDAVLFYALTEQHSSHSIAALLSNLGRQQASFGLDLRFVPVDASPSLLIKSACFFSALYSSNRESPSERKGFLLVVDDTELVL